MLVLKEWEIFNLEGPTGFEPAMKVLQTFALPLGYGPINNANSTIILL